MKKFFLLAAAAIVAFASCSKNDQPEQREAAIGFSSYAGRPVSKADAGSFLTGTTTLMKDTHFGVFAFATGTNAFDGTNISNVFMNNVDVKYLGTSATDEQYYDYSPLRYWPNDETNNKLSFWAYYPYGALGTAPKYGENTFTVEEDPADMVDLMFSDVEADKTYSTAVNANNSHKGVVSMKFHHALSMVKFKVNLDDTYTGTTIKLVSIKLSNINLTGVLAPKATYSPTLPFYWKSVSNPATVFTVFEETAGQTVTKTTDGVFVPTGVENDDAFLMIPQTLGNTVKVTVVYTVQTGTDAAIENTAELVLNTAKDKSNNAITEWAMNQNTVYTFTIGLKPIKFIASVTDWDPVTESGITIPTE